MTHDTFAGARPVGLAVPAAREAAARPILDALKPGSRVVMTTHVNADGDGTGSEVGLWHLLAHLGVKAEIANPTPFPSRFDFLLAGLDGVDRSRDGGRAIERADVVVVLDISHVSRLGDLGRLVEASRVPVVCIDHHVSPQSLPDGPRLIDPTACATGELVYDVARTAGWAISREAALGLYVAILTDTGGFRFSNTSPRALEIAADLLRNGLDPEDVYGHVYASEPEGKLRLMGEVLSTLVVEDPPGIAWVTVPPGALERHRVDPTDLDGVVELPRSVVGVKLALLFRELANARIKVSFRSVGDVDVATLAERFGGGGHRKAAGASLEGSLGEVQARVLEVARSMLTGDSR
ncbi:MAG TPA: bifunctional oligoribonuclease/PAP phosphatase NrnA [Gemmatimonadales bacterium]|jgi:phosphoesterase RecJ-like protein